MYLPEAIVDTIHALVLQFGLFPNGIMFSDLNTILKLMFLH